MCKVFLIFGPDCDNNMLYIIQEIGTDEGRDALLLITIRLIELKTCLKDNRI